MPAPVSQRWFWAMVSLHWLLIEGCTEFSLPRGANDGAVIITRAMEYTAGLGQWNVVNNLPGQKRQSSAPYLKDGLAWTSKYGSATIRQTNYAIGTSDGVNTAGLSVSALWFPHYAHYQAVGNNVSSALYHAMFALWALDNFATPEEVVAALPTVRVWAIDGTLWPLHYGVYGSNGTGFIIEYDGSVGSGYTVYRSMGVLTNAPSYGWHTTNLRNYVNLSPWHDKAAGKVPAPFGYGSGLLGLPGGNSPPARFVRVAVTRRLMLSLTNGSKADESSSSEEGEPSYAPCCKDLESLLVTAQHLANTVDVMKGLSLNDPWGTNVIEYTVWVVVKQLQPYPRLFIRTYNDMRLRPIDVQVGKSMTMIPLSRV
eukprot:NODE_505_length_1336_cov_391.489510_g364_i0.p1 GENE.NODE_505_length_1336_cov_391.489510_g364_i0~~NODE_505_length_1336_cov_391.489510_g364_i0.p1  ORF type:complete len:385 (-),score=122.75 NODE_505_length_1336_cov_391.489510_g364_i0:181-1287(-)